MYYDITVAKRGKLLDTIVSFLSNTVRLVSSLRFLCGGHCISEVLSSLLLLLQLSKLECACTVVYSIFCLDLQGFGLKGSGLARFYYIYGSVCHCVCLCRLLL